MKNCTIIEIPLQKTVKTPFPSEFFSQFKVELKALLTRNRVKYVNQFRIQYLLEIACNLHKVYGISQLIEYVIW